MEPLPAGVPRSEVVRVDATCNGVSGQRRCNSHFRNRPARIAAVLLVLAAQHAHSKLQAASRACPTAARQPPRLNENSEGAMCGWRDAEQFGAAHGGSAAEPTDRRLVSL